MWIVEGLDDGRWALISKTHHCMVDGVSGDRSAQRPARRRARGRAARRRTTTGTRTPEPTSRRARRALAGRSARASPYEVVRAALSVAPRPASRRWPARRHAGSGLTSMARAAAAAAAQLAQRADRPAPPLGLGARRASPTSSRSASQHSAAPSTTSCSPRSPRGFRDLLLSRGECVDGRVVRTLVPGLGPRRATSAAPTTTRSRRCSPSCPSAIEDPLERLAAVHEQMQELKALQARRSRRSGSLPSAASRRRCCCRSPAASRTRLPQHALQHGDDERARPAAPALPRRPPDAGGIPLRAARWLSPDRVAIFSYDGSINFGVTGDGDTTDDLDVLTGAIEASIAELLAPSSSPGPAATVI